MPLYERMDVSLSSSVHHVSSVAPPSAFSDRRPCKEGKTDAQWVRSALSHICLPPQQPASLTRLMTGCIISPIPSTPTPHNYTTVPICPLCINSSSWNPVLSSIRSQNHQPAWGWFWLSVGPRQPASPSHAWTTITLSQHRNTDRERNTAINIVHWRLSDHLSSSQQDASHHNWKRIFSLSKCPYHRTTWEQKTAETDTFLPFAYSVATHCSSYEELWDKISERYCQTCHCSSCYETVTYWPCQKNKEIRQFNQNIWLSILPLM